MHVKNRTVPMVATRIVRTEIHGNNTINTQAADDIILLNVCVLVYELSCANCKARNKFNSFELLVLVCVVFLVYTSNTNYNTISLSLIVFTLYVNSSQTIWSCVLYSVATIKYSRKFYCYRFYLLAVMRH